MNLPPRLVAVGRVTRAHGVKGEVAVLPLSQVVSRFEPGSRVQVGEEDERVLVVAGARPHRGRLLVTFEGVDDREEAQSLQGAYLFVPVAEAPPLPEGEYWTHDLVGSEVVTDLGRSLGSLVEVITTPANDVWVVRGEEGEVLVPALKDVVAEVDLSARRVVVREVSGLTAP